MKQRLITAAVAIFMFAIILIYSQTILLNIMISLAIGVAMFELFSVTKIMTHKLLSYICIAFSMVIPFINFITFNVKFYLIFAVFVFILFGIFLIKHQTIQIQDVCTAFTFTILIPLSIATFVFLRDSYGYTAIYYILLISAMGWGADSGAYFMGKFFGKHKLAPTISPNKTIEGVYGGIIASTFFVVVFSLVYKYIMGHFDVVIEYNWIILLLINIFCTLIGVMGDLTFSAIKRQFKIKDYGYIFPGHGGILDRFDSVCFIAPVFYMIIRMVNIFN